MSRFECLYHLPKVLPVDSNSVYDLNFI